MFDPAANKWKYVAKMKSARYKFGMVTVDDKIYALGSNDDDPNSINMEFYDPIINQWTRMTTTYDNKSFACTEHNGTIVACGGEKKIKQFDPRQGSWINLGECEKIREASLVSVGHTVFCIGGSSSGKALQTVKFFDMKMRKWNEVSPMIAARRNHSSILYNDTILVFGGRQEDAIGAVLKYSIESDEWKRDFCMPNPYRYAFGAVAM